MFNANDAFLNKSGGAVDGGYEVGGVQNHAA